MIPATRDGDGGTLPGQGPGAPAETAAAFVVPETVEAIGSLPAAAGGAPAMRIANYVRHEWDDAESSSERAQEECRGALERWAAALMERVPHLNWTRSGFGAANVTCQEGKKPSGERFRRCVVHLPCWAEYRGRLGSPGGQGGPGQVPPALTPEEWRSHAPLDRTLAQFAPDVARDNAHGAAALALHGQPYGFTWDDYYELIDQAHEIEHDHGGDLMFPERQHQVDALRSIAARIAALLPPRGGEG